MCAPQITSIVFIERMIMPPAGHGPATIQKFVATVGCDNLVHLFRDIPEESVCVFNTSRASSGSNLLVRAMVATTKQATAYPSHVIPSNKDVALGNTHTEALLALAFCPPHTLATAALDGCIRLWSLNTGKHVGVLYRPEPNTKMPALKGKRSGDTDTGTSTSQHRLVSHDGDTSTHWSTWCVATIQQASTHH